jgi:hypothetical protein
LNKRRSFLPIWLQKFIVLGWISWVTRSLIQIQNQIARITHPEVTVAEEQTESKPTEPPFMPHHEQPVIAAPLIPFPAVSRDFLEEVIRGADQK